MTNILLSIIATLLFVIAAMAILIPAHLSRLNDHAASLRRKARRLKSIEKKLVLLIEKLDDRQDNNMHPQADEETKKEIPPKNRQKQPPVAMAR